MITISIVCMRIALLLVLWCQLCVDCYVPAKVLASTVRRHQTVRQKWISKTSDRCARSWHGILVRWYFIWKAPTLLKYFRQVSEIVHKIAW